MTLKSTFLAAGILIASSCTLGAETLPMSDDRYLVEADLAGMSVGSLRIARNEIYARHGYRFNSADLRQHFSQYSWYSPYTNNVSLSNLEQRNVSFIKRYEDSASLRSNLQNYEPIQKVQTATVVVVPAVTSKALGDLEERYRDLSRQVEALEHLAKMQRDLAEASEQKTSIHTLALAEIVKQLSANEAAITEVKQQAETKYQTSIKPTQTESQMTLREMSRSFPRVPWYKPETVNAYGEFWLEPVVHDSGELIYSLKFLDPEAENERVTSEFALNGEETKALRDGLKKAFDWSIIAKDKSLRDRFQKTVVCTPVVKCEDKVVGNTSTQIDFLVFEGGATGARVIRNKGKYQESYGMSIESAALLSAYFDYVISSGESDFEAGSRTDEEIDDLFK